MSENYTNTNERELDWNDSISHDSTFELLPAGDYFFTVQSFERARHPGSEKLPPCNKAILRLEVSDGQHTGTMTHNLFLHQRCEGMLCAFFTAIGQRQKGEELRMDWPKVPGSTGRCKIKVRAWQGKDGDERQSNDIQTFYPYDAQAMATKPRAGYKPGTF